MKGSLPSCSNSSLVVRREEPVANLWTADRSAMLISVITSLHTHPSDDDMKVSDATGVRNVS